MNSIVVENQTGILRDGLTRDSTDKIDKLEAELIKAKRKREKCENELAREKEISNQLMSKKAFIDLLAQEIATLKSDKEKLVTNMTEMNVENTRLKTYVAFLNEKIYNLQSDLTRADDEKDKAEKERRQIQEKNKEKDDLINEKDQLIKELNMRISLLDKEKTEAAIEGEKKLLAAVEENAMLRKELTLIVQKKQDEQKQLSDQTGHKGTMISGGNGRYQMFSLERGERATRLHGVEGVTCIELVSDELLATSSPDFSINLWNWTRGELVNSFVGHTGLVLSLALLSNTILVSGSINAEIRMWNIDSGICFRTLIHSRNDKYAYAVFALQPLPKGLLASGSECGSIKIWNLNNGECVKSLANEKSGATISETFLTFFGRMRNPIYCLASLPKNRLACGKDDFRIRIWDLEKYVCLTTLSGHSGAVYALQLLSGNMLVSASADNTIIKWNLHADTCQVTGSKVLIGHSNEVFSLVRVSNSTIASASFDNTIRLWDTESANCTRIIHKVTFRKPQGRLSANCLKFSQLELPNHK